MKFTPGPWKIEDYTQQITGNNDEGCIIGSLNSRIYDETPDYDEMQANGNLIEAAPEMYEALKYVVKYHRNHDSGEGELFGLDFVTTCINALRKANPDYTLKEEN